VAGTVNVATVQEPAAAAGHPVSVELAVKAPNALVSASPDWVTEVVPMALSSDASATMAALVASLQSNVIFVVPGVTPMMSPLAIVPVPADTVTLQTALTNGALSAASAEVDINDRPDRAMIIDVPIARTGFPIDRFIRRLIRTVFRLIISDAILFSSINWKGAQLLLRPVYHIKKGPTPPHQ
jgi:hypothetical protein